MDRQVGRMSRYSTMAMAFLLVLIAAVGSLISASVAESGVAADGAGWTLQASPNPAGSDNTMLASVSCMSAVTCMAVGYSSGKHGLLTLAELLHKTTWTIEKTPDAAKDNYLTGVSCSGPAWCTAVGTSFTPDAVQAPGGGVERKDLVNPEHALGGTEYNCRTRIGVLQPAGLRALPSGRLQSRVPKCRGTTFGRALERVEVDDPSDSQPARREREPTRRCVPATATDACTAGWQLCIRRHRPVHLRLAMGRHAMVDAKATQPRGTR